MKDVGSSGVAQEFECSGHTTAIKTVFTLKDFWAVSFQDGETHRYDKKFQKIGSGCGDSLVKAVGHALLRCRHPISKRLICKDILTHPALDIEIEVPFRHKTCFGFHGKTHNHKMIHNLWNVQCPLMDRQRSHIPEP